MKNLPSKTVHITKDFVPLDERETWVYKNPKVFASLRKGIQDAAVGKGKVVRNLNEFLEEL